MRRRTTTEGNSSRSDVERRGDAGAPIPRSNGTESRRLSPVSYPPVLLSQQGLPSDPASDGLDDAVLWDYSFTFDGDADVAFSVAFNEERTIEYAMTLEETDGMAQVRVTASSGAPPLVQLPEMTLVPMAAGVYRYQTADGPMLTFADASEMRRRTVVFPRLDVVNAQSVRTSVAGESFRQPHLPFVENEQVITIGDEPNTLAAHLTALLQALLGRSPFASQPLALECRYAYTIGNMPIEAPVLLFMRQDVAIGFDEELLDQIAAGLRQWLDAVQPPATDARLIFGLTLWNAIPRTDALLLRLTRVALPMTAVTM